MTEVYIKYNPYRLKTDITIDGQAPKQNSQLNFGERRLQEWVDDLPRILCEECGSRRFKITFYGTIPDYEDMEAMVAEARQKGIEIELEHQPAKEDKNKEEAVKSLFKQIQEGPFPELKSADIKQAFESAINSDFMVSVVACMSAGKSTVINSLLSQKLMPAKQEACTATITEIKDNDADHFCARVFNKDGKQIDSSSNLTYADMERFNSNPDVFKIKIEGDIPFVPADEIALVLVDTPGPNNSRDASHRQATQRMLLDSAKPLVLYVLNATQLAVDDDNSLLKLVSDSMKVGGKQSRDRFIFVVNKLDSFNKGEDSVDSALNKVKSYLADHGIENPNIYPASALTALNIRTVLAESDDDDDDVVYEAKGRVRKFNKNEELHFENYAPLPSSARARVAKRLEEALADGDRNAQALIHSGIVSIEEAISMYVTKYAKTAKLKNIVDVFKGKIEGKRSFAETEEQIRKNKSLRQEIVGRITAIEQKLQDGEEAKKLKDQMVNVDYTAEVKDASQGIVTQMSKELRAATDGMEQKLSRVDAEDAISKWRKLAEKLQADVQVRLEDLLENNVKHNAERLLGIYKEKLASLVEDVGVGGIAIDPFTLMSGDLPGNLSASQMISSASATEQVKTGRRWVENEDKHWWNPFTWFDESGHWVSIYENREYVDLQKLADSFFDPIEEQLTENRHAAVEYAREQTAAIKAEFIRQFDALDAKLLEKLNDLKACAQEEKQAAEKVADSVRKLAWLNSVQSQMDAILDI